MPDTKLAFFECIDKNVLKEVKICLDTGNIVYYFESNVKITVPTKGKLVSISDVVLDMSILSSSGKHTHNIIDRFFSEKFSKSNLIKNTRSLIKADYVVDMYRKYIFDKLFIRTRMEYIINALCSRHKADKCVFYTFDGLGFHASEYSVLNNNTKVVKLKHSLFFRIKNAVRKLLYPFYPLYMILMKFGGISFNKKRKYFSLGLNISHPKSIFAMNYYTESIMIGDELTKDDILFLDSSPKNVNIAEYKKRGYNYYLVQDSRSAFSMSLISKFLFRFLPFFIKSLLFTFFESGPNAFISAKAASDFILWNIVCDRFEIRNYARWYQLENQSKIAVLRENNTKTWYIYPDCSSPAEYDPNFDTNIKSDPYFTMMHYDYGVFYGERLYNNLKNQRNFFDKYVFTGISFSQIDHEIMTGKLPSKIKGIISKKIPKGNYKFVSVFDTTIDNSDAVKIEDGIKFGEDMLKLLNDFPKIVILFKAKKELEITPKLAPVYKKLENHERCIMFYRYGDAGISAPEVIAVSNLVISAPFTSTSIEALGCKKRAIFYDPASRYTDKRLYYQDKFPNFVASGYDHMKELVKFWLYQTDDAALEKYLKDHIKQEFDPYLDGRGLSRLRKILKEGISDEIIVR
ncbi:polysaccharide biosynthesis PFTS motif protein [Candidatus Micrarchaeota archaeon]|nr:polysaccharide biosynthesis PFTS motif protein [Candidatus Micrarchaeota archaeon]